MHQQASSHAAKSLVGKRVLLRAIREEDLEPLRLWYNDPSTFPFMSRSEPLTAADQRQWFEALIADYDRTRVFAIDRLDNGRLTGSITLRNLSDPARRGELGILMGLAGSGFGSDAIRTMLAHAFDHLELGCVSLEVRGDNRRAITAYMRAGFRPEGVLRRRMFKAGVVHDVYSMSILRDEFIHEPYED